MIALSVRSYTALNVSEQWEDSIIWSTETFLFVPYVSYSYCRQLPPTWSSYCHDDVINGVINPPIQKQLTIALDPVLGGGVIITVPPGFPEYQCGINSEEECDFEVDYNAQVTLEAQANSGYAFSHWEINNQTMGDVDGTIVISMSEDKDVVAVYARTFQDTAGNFDVTAGDECVIYVRSETGIIYDACHGDAADCFEQAQAAGYATGSEPRESAIIVFDRVPDTALAVGHVGIVTSYNGDYVSMHDSNWVGYHTIGNHTELIGENGYSIKGYIYFTPHQ